MKKIFTFFFALANFSSSLSVISCIQTETRNRNKVSLSMIRTELALVNIIDLTSSISEITEDIFQDGIYRTLETNTYRGSTTTQDLIFKYYDSSNNEMIWQNLTFSEPNDKTITFAFQIIANENSEHFADQTEILKTTLYRQTELIDLATLNLTYDIEQLKTKNEEELASYFNSLNPTIFFNARQTVINKNDNNISIIAALTSDRYKNELIINLIS